MNRSFKLIKITLFLFLIGAFAQLSSAQLSIEFLGGLTMSKLRSADPDINEISAFKYSSGAVFGTGLTYELKNKVKLSGEIQYSQKGFKNVFDEQFGKQSSIFSWRAHSIDFLPGVHYNPLPYLEVGAGLDIGYAFNEKMKNRPIDKGQPLKPGEGIWQDPYTTHYKNLDVGVYGLIGARYRDMMIFVRYNLGISPVDHVKVVDAQGQRIRAVNEYSRQLQIGLNMAFPLKNPNKID